MPGYADGPVRLIGVMLLIKDWPVPVSKPIEPWAEFWKFRDIDNRFLDILKERRLWFSTPEFFNDPFDCQVDIEKTFAAIRSSLQENLDSHFSEIISRVEDHVRNTRYAYLCLCKIWHQTLMWSHYGEHHQGAALGFTFDANGPFRMAELKYRNIIYKSTALSDQISATNHSLGMSRAFGPRTPGLMVGEWLQFFEYLQAGIIELYEVVRFMKAECWKYEEEFRFEAIIDDPKANGLHRSFAPTDLKHVLIGVRCPADRVEAISSILSEPEWSHVELWRCTQDRINLVLTAERIR